MFSRNLALVAFVCPFLWTGAAIAGARDDVLEAVGRCAALADDKARLDCYDKLAPRVKNALATPPASLDRPPTTAEQRSWFGFDVGSLFGGGSSAPTTPEQFGKERTQQAQAARTAGEAQAVDSITAGVTDVAFNPFGRFVLFLDNGQIWRQLEGDADKAHFPGKPKDNKVTISRGALGSYNMTINDSAKVFKVTRLK